MVFIKLGIRPINIDSKNIHFTKQNKCSCQVGLNREGKLSGKAFFCEIPIDNKKVPVMISYDFNFDNLEESDYINLKFNLKAKQLNLNEDREIYLDRNIQILIIEILPDIDNVNNFLKVDLDAKLKEDENAYLL